jgi:hypothetical protein
MLTLSKGTVSPDDPILNLFKRAQSQPRQFGPLDAGNDSLEKRNPKPKKKKVRAADHPAIQNDLDVIIGTDERKKLQAQILSDKVKRVIPNNGHHGGQRAANPVESPDDDPVEHVKSLGIGPNTAGELDMFKSIHRRGRVALSSKEFFEKKY